MVKQQVDLTHLTSSAVKLLLQKSSYARHRHAQPCRPGAPRVQKAVSCTYIPAAHTHEGKRALHVKQQLLSPHTCQAQGVGSKYECGQVGQPLGNCAHCDADVARSVGVGQGLGRIEAVHICAELIKEVGEKASLGGTPAAHRGSSDQSSLW